MYSFGEAFANSFEAAKQRKLQSEAQKALNEFNTARLKEDARQFDGSLEMQGKSLAQDWRKFLEGMGHDEAMAKINHQYDMTRQNDAQAHESTSQRIAMNHQKKMAEAEMSFNGWQAGLGRALEYEKMDVNERLARAGLKLEGDRLKIAQDTFDMEKAAATQAADAKNTFETEFKTFAQMNSPQLTGDQFNEDGTVKHYDGWFNWEREGQHNESQKAFTETNALLEQIGKSEAAGTRSAMMQSSLGAIVNGIQKLKDRIDKAPGKSRKALETQVAFLISKASQYDPSVGQMLLSMQNPVVE